MIKSIVYRSLKSSCGYKSCKIQVPYFGVKTIKLGIAVERRNKMDFPVRNQLFINGEWKNGTSGKTIQNVNPYNDELLAEIQLANKTDIDEAYEAALAAQKSWAETPAPIKAGIIEKTIEILERHSNDIANLLGKEVGGNVFKSHLEVGLTTAFMKEAATYPFRMKEEVLPSIIPGKVNRLQRLPVGVVGVIAPWNVPLHLGMRSIISAIATGNTVVLKPDLQTFISGGIVVAQAFEEAGLPKGVFNLIIADLAEVGDYFIEHPIPRMISFTGSTAAGRHIGSVAGKHLKKAALELGGNNVFIVLDDADVEQAASAATFGKFMNNGQICMCINRLIVDRKIYSQFVNVFTEKVRKLTVGDQTNPETVIGPLINRKQVDKILGFVDASVKEGAKILVQGDVKGNVLAPIVLIDVTNEMTIAQNEIFGPVAAIIPVENEEEAIRVANDSPNGLSGAVFSGSLERGCRVAEQIHTGMIHVNDQTINDEPHIAFGGEKGSGLGRFNGEWSLEEFTTVKWISLQKEYRDFPF
jgi:aldehyde dehydrogenase (NAD+)